MKKLLEQMAKFSVVGIVAFLIDYGLMILLTEAFSIDYLISATISFAVSVVFNYVASMRYVFQRKKNANRAKEFTLFVVLSVIGLLINDACMWVGTELTGIDYRITKIAATVVVSVWNFVTRKLLLEDHS